MNSRAGRQPLSLRARAVALLAQREHSELELRRKLARIARDMAAKKAAELAGAVPSAAFDEDSISAAAHLAGLDADSAADASTDHAAEIDDTLTWLRAQGYLDESRFVEARLHARTARWGQRRIEQELSQHGLSLDAEQRAQLAQTELGRACELLRRKFGAVPEQDPANEARQMRFLMGRGFGSELARRAIRSVRLGADSED